MTFKSQARQHTSQEGVYLTHNPHSSVSRVMGIRQELPSLLVFLYPPFPLTVTLRGSHGQH